MVENHKHKGIERKDGSLRPHPIDRVHKDTYAKKCHTLAIAAANRKLKTTKKKVAKKKVVKRATVKPKRKLTKPTKVESIKQLFGIKKKVVESENVAELPVDDEGYIHVDLTQIKGVKGARLTFVVIKPIKGTYSNQKLKTTTRIQFEK